MSCVILRPLPTFLILQFLYGLQRPLQRLYTLVLYRFVSSIKKLKISSSWRKLTQYNVRLFKKRSPIGPVDW